MPDKKLCPLTHHVIKGTYDQEATDFDLCEEKGCAWWIERTQCCAIIVIGNDLALSQIGKR